MSVSYQSATLDCGIRLRAEVDPAAYTSAIGFFVKTGARDEASELMGVSHFLEHMMFKGTAKRSAEDVNRDFDNIGARSNAYTSSEMTAFHASVLPDKLGAATEILSDMMRPALREADFATEKGVILEEIAMYADEPVWILYEKLVEEYFGASSPLAHRVLGTPSTITAMQAEQMRSYFDNRYSADNTFVAVAGNVDFDAVARQVQSLCGSWRRTNAARSYQHPAPKSVNFEIKSDKVSRAYRMSMSPGPAMNDADRYAAFCCAHLLGGPDNSLLHWALIETGLAESAEAGFDPHDGLGTGRLFVACEPESLDKVWAIATDQARRLPELVTAKDLDRVKSRVATGVVLAGEKPEGRMHRVGRLAMYGDQYRSLEEELDLVNSVTLEAVADIIRKFPFEPATVGTLVPGAKAD